MFLRTVAANGNRRKSLANTENGSGRRGSAAAEMERRKSSLNNMTNTSRYDRRQSAIEGRYLLNRTDTQLFNIPESLTPSLVSIQRRSLSAESNQPKDQLFDLTDWPSSRTSTLSRPTSFQPLGRVRFRLRGQQLFETFESTLERFPDTLLGDKLKRDQYFDQRLNCYIINRCQHSFSAVLFYYQSDGILSRPLDIDRENFIKELEFYQIEECIDARHRQEQKMVEDNNRSKLSPQGKAREFIWKILEYQERTLLAKFCFYFYLITSILAIVIFCAETEPQFKSKTFWDPLETVVNVLFTIEYILRLYSAPSIKAFVFSAFGVVDLFAIVPFYCNVFIRLAGNKAVTSLSILTLLRVLRVFKLTRCNEGLRILMMTIYESLHHLRSLFVCIGITSLFFATLLFFIESDILKISETNNFESIPDSFWYTVITATAVGYGDMYPKTSYGKVVGSVLASVGLLLFCLPTPMLVNKFVECYYIRMTLTKEINPQRKAVIKRMRETFME